MKLKGWVFSRREKGKKEKGIQALFFAVRGKGAVLLGEPQVVFFFWSNTREIKGRGGRK